MPWDKLNEWSKLDGRPGFVQPQQALPQQIQDLPEVEIAPEPSPTFATSPQAVKDYIFRSLQNPNKYRAPFAVPVPRIKN